jgi:hypothetical protein
LQAASAEREEHLEARCTKMSRHMRFLVEQHAQERAAERREHDLERLANGLTTQALIAALSEQLQESQAERARAERRWALERAHHEETLSTEASKVRSTAERADALPQQCSSACMELSLWQRSSLPLSLPWIPPASAFPERAPYSALLPRVRVAVTRAAGGAGALAQEGA